jgi:tetratricopeptide (TPR) repeat protein
MRTVVVCLVILACGAVIPAQGPPDPRNVVTGEIESEGRALPPGLIVEAASLEGRGRVEQAVVLPTGAFEFRSLRSGTYEIRLVDGYGRLLHRELMSIPPPMQEIRLRLPQTRAARPPQGVVSAAQWFRRAPRGAAKELARALRAWQKGDVRRTMVHLEKAIRIYPDFVEAHNNLGVCYVKLGQLDQAVAAFERASALDPKAPGIQQNLRRARTLRDRFRAAVPSGP